MWCTFNILPAGPSLNHRQGEQPQSATTTDAASGTTFQLQQWPLFCNPNQHVSKQKLSVQTETTFLKVIFKWKYLAQVVMQNIQTTKLYLILKIQYDLSVL